MRISVARSKSLRALRENKPRQGFTKRPQRAKHAENAKKTVNAMPPSRAFPGFYETLFLNPIRLSVAGSKSLRALRENNIRQGFTQRPQRAKHAETAKRTVNAMPSLRAFPGFYEA
jgi:hypothetical protein